MQTALFTNYGNLAIIKRDSTQNGNNDYIDKIYELTEEGPKLIKHLGIYECIDKPKVNEHRNKMYIKDLDTDYVILNLNKCNNEIKYVLGIFPRYNKQAIFHAFNIEGNLLNKEWLQIVESLQSSYTDCNCLDDVQRKLVNIFKSENKLNIDRTELETYKSHNDVAELKLWGNN